MSTSSEFGGLESTAVVIALGVGAYFAIHTISDCIFRVIGVKYDNLSIGDALTYPEK
jgi:hypothetical protein